MTSARGGEPARLVARGLTDVRSVGQILWPAFRDQHGAPVELDYRQDVDMSRLRSEVAGSEAGERPDVLIVADPILFARDGLLAPIDDGGAVRPPAWLDDARRWTALYVQPIVATYNALYRSPPRSWQELADPAWRGRLVVEAPVRMLTTGPAFAELRSVMGDPAWTDWLTRLAALDLEQVADNERAVLGVATGSRWGGLANVNVARRVRPGSPVRHVFLDPTPCIPAFAAVVDGGQAPALAEAFVRWLASPGGQAAVGRTGRIPATGLDDAAGPIASVIPPGVGSVAGRADWVSDPDRWIATYAEIFPLPGEGLSGKRRTSI